MHFQRFLHPADASVSVHSLVCYLGRWSLQNTVTGMTSCWVLDSSRNSYLSHLFHTSARHALQNDTMSSILCHTRLAFLLVTHCKTWDLVLSRALPEEHVPIVSSKSEGHCCTLVINAYTAWRCIAVDVVYHAD